MEAKRQAEEIGLAVATSLPPEIEQMLEHIATITDLLALKHGGGDPQVVEMQRAIQRESGRMRRMLRRMHLYGQIPQLYANRFDLQAPAELLAVCAPTITRVALEAAGRWNRQSSLVLNLEDVPLSLGEDYLGVMVDELVDNACKFSLAGTPIEISVRRLHGFWTLSVSDRGTGMTVEQIANVGAFRQFWSGAKKPPGLGMGLALVQGVARLHGCEFALESAAGVTTASVLVPLEA
jgi:signal transduction histidine kinase